VQVVDGHIVVEVGPVPINPPERPQVEPLERRRKA
jgi:hypothetical protein